MTAKMQPVDELQRILEAYNNDATRSENTPQELDDYLRDVAKTGRAIFKWSQIKLLYSEKLKQAIKLLKEHSTPPSEIPKHVNIEPFCFESMESMLQSRLNFFDDPPFTIQRLTELLLSPRKEYNRLDKYMRALEKNVMVANMQTVVPQPMPEPEDSDEEERRRVVAEILATQMSCQPLADGNKRRAVEVEEPTAKKAKLGELDNKMSCDEHADKSKEVDRNLTGEIKVIVEEHMELEKPSKRSEYIALLKLASEEYTRQKETYKALINKSAKQDNPTGQGVPVQPLNELNEKGKNIPKSLENSDKTKEESKSNGQAGKTLKRIGEYATQADQPTTQAEEPDNQAGVPDKQTEEPGKQREEPDQHVNEIHEKKAEKSGVQTDDPNNQIDETVSQAKESAEHGCEKQSEKSAMQTDEPNKQVVETATQTKKSDGLIDEAATKVEKTDKHMEESPIQAKEPAEQIKEFATQAVELSKPVKESSIQVTDVKKLFAKSTFLEVPNKQIENESSIIAEQTKVEQSIVVEEIEQFKQEPNAGLKDETVESNSTNANNSNDVTSLPINESALEGENETYQEVSESDTAAGAKHQLH